jgi:D-sedoheptulose 7-phosphate isomerase
MVAGVALQSNNRNAPQPHYRCLEAHYLAQLDFLVVDPNSNGRIGAISVGGSFNNMKTIIKSYVDKLTLALSLDATQQIPVLADSLYAAWRTGNDIYICGNGGSAGNSVHLANDFVYGAGAKNGRGLRAEALSANPAVITCLANDTGYENIYSEQLRVKARPGDVLIVLSGSGNSPNIVKALEVGNVMGMSTFAILGFSGGVCKKIAQHALHFEVHDMQIAEDLQLIIGHMCMQYLSQLTLSGNENL